MNNCPLCGLILVGYPALSRVDNKTDICSNCGLREALIPQTVKAFKKLWSVAPGKIDFTRLEERERR